MNRFAPDLNSLLTVVAAVLNDEGVLLQANAGFLRLLPASHSMPIGSRQSRLFVQPGYKALLSAIDSPGSDGYQGLLTLGDYADKTRTLRGRVWRRGHDICVLAEYDIVDLERLNDAMLDLNQESSVAQHSLTRAHVAMRQREGEIVEASLTDALTSVGNRRKLEQALLDEIANSQRNGEALSMIMTDIDHFKRVNDEYGHQGGDQVLRHFGALLKSQIRVIDTVARFGGEEFVVLMPHTTAAQAAAKAEQIRSVLAAAPIEPLTRAVTSSFGVAQHAAGESGDALIQRADAALYEAKAGGRNRVIVAADPV